MFLGKKYILANELVQKMNIHIANISMLRTKFEDDGDFTTMVKMNNCTFINSKSYKLPNNIKVGIHENTFTDMSDKLPCTWFHSEYELTGKEIKNADFITGKVNISGKEFYTFKPEFVQMMKYKVPYILDEKETMECKSKGQILGYIKLSKDKYFTWY